ncbi:hypothetical protein [Nucisporomicrobium flavum]|uniref:hypothetical protein n=1 Tax=Nucisporomicrobium flavum TaxID=2785915 RepID=UPI0018F34447|nr:hypothetical protein [Nucisporomicrobium flavum]
MGPEGKAEDGATVLVRELAVAAAVVVVLALTQRGLMTNAAVAADALLMAVGAGGLSALFSDWRARVGALGMSGGAFLLVAPGIGSAPGIHAWEYLPLFAAAVTVGSGYRRLSHAEQS